MMPFQDKVMLPGAPELPWRPWFAEGASLTPQAQISKAVSSSLATL
jgi:hypothetical protein